MMPKYVSPMKYAGSVVVCFGEWRIERWPWSREYVLLNGNPTLSGFLFGAMSKSKARALRKRLALCGFTGPHGSAAKRMRV